MKAPMVHLFIQREDEPTIAITTGGVEGVLVTWIDGNWNRIGSEVIDTPGAARMSNRLITTGFECEALAFAALFQHEPAAA